jgi:hypothetical protein
MVLVVNYLIKQHALAFYRNVQALEHFTMLSALHYVWSVAQFGDKWHIKELVHFLTFTL